MREALAQHAVFPGLVTLAMSTEGYTPEWEVLHVERELLGALSRWHAQAYGGGGGDDDGDDEGEKEGGAPALRLVFGVAFEAVAGNTRGMPAWMRPSGHDEL